MKYISSSKINMKQFLKNLNNLKSLISNFEKNYKIYKDNYSEADCRKEFIEPFLEILGWNVRNSEGTAPQYREVISEKFSTYEDRPDYSMTLKGVTKFFIEVKKPKVDILNNRKPAFQARKYGWNANHKITVLTNFEYLIIYDTRFYPEEKDNTDVARYKKFHFSEYFEKFSEIMALISKESVYNGNFDNFCNKELPRICGDRNQIDELFLDQINEWRLVLSNNLYSSNKKYREIGKLNDVVQEFINQIIFLRICEDKNLPLYHKLKDTIKIDNLVKIKLEELFKDADKKYNSGIFNGENLIFDLDNDVISEIIKSLYYPKSIYLFNIIEPKLLGKIYEVFLTKQLYIDENDKIILLEKKECINKSIVTTPIEVVKYMVEKVLNKICYKKTPTEIKKIKILDLACGSGIFLEEAYNFLINYCLEWYLKNDPQSLIDVGKQEKKLPLKEKKEILTSCIYGIDIDVHAVEVAKFSLLIKLIEDETSPSLSSFYSILPNLNKNIIHGNSLIEEQDIENTKINLDTLIDIAPSNWNNINNGELFDIIIGNPPYVKIEEIRKFIPEQEILLYKNKFKSAYKQYDKYFLFLEKALEKIKEDGIICEIIPNKFIKNNAGEELRKMIMSNKYLVSIDDFGANQLFQDQTTYSSIIVLKKCENNEFKYRKIISPILLWTRKFEEYVKFKSDDFNEKPWILTDDSKILKILENKKRVPITDFVEIFGGIQTSAEKNKTYWFSNSEIINETETTFEINRNNKNYIIEKKILKPYFKPVKKLEKGLNTYSILKTDKWIIYPYDSNGNIIPLKEMQLKNKGVFKYLVDNFLELAPKHIFEKGKRDVPHARKDTWYCYGRSQNISAFNNCKKLIVGILSSEPFYGYDDNDFLISLGGTAGYCAIKIKEGSKYELEFIQAWLTSDFTEKILELRGSDFENDFFSRGISQLKNLSIVDLDFNDLKQKEIHDSIVKDTRKIYELNEKLKNNPEKRINNILINEKDKLIKSIKIKINKIYTIDEY
ncbi:MAG: Eco57I restriction-modification methylase domain-containing protein [Cetobacterium sp.]